MHGRLSRVINAAIVATVLTAGAVGTTSAAGPSLRDVRAATTAFRSLGAAGNAGYGAFPPGSPLHECIASFDGSGAMGFHWVNGGLIDGDVDPLRPEVLVYAPGGHGGLHLVALEYVVFQADWKAKHGNTTPSLFGQPFMATGANNRYEIPPFYSLHLWLYKSNPAGRFAPFNPNVSCRTPFHRSLDAARAATTAFRSPAAATRAGYGAFPAGVPLHDCITSLDGSGTMGFHWVNGALLDGDVDALHPEVLVYNPGGPGGLHLVALEYVVFQADWKAKHGDTVPVLFGQRFMATGPNNRYEIPAFFSLHVWLYKANPSGLFAPFNPRASCGRTPASASAAPTWSSIDAALRSASIHGDRAKYVCAIG